MNRHSSPLTAAALALTLVACGDDPTSVRFEVPVRDELVTGSGLVQTLEISNTRPARGSVVEIRSVVRNESPEGIPVTLRICELDVRGVDFAAPPETAVCAGYSMHTTLAPGETVRQSNAQVVRSPRGHYLLEVRHLLDPEYWAGIDIWVQ